MCVFVICCFFFVKLKKCHQARQPGSELLLCIRLSADDTGGQRVIMYDLYQLLLCGYFIALNCLYLSLVMRKPAFLHKNYAKTKMQISFAVISAFVFTTWIVQSLYFLNPKFLTSNHLMWLYSPICIGPGRKPRGPVFSQRGSFFSVSMHFCVPAPPNHTYPTYYKIRIQNYNF